MHRLSSKAGSPVRSGGVTLIQTGEWTHLKGRGWVWGQRVLVTNFNGDTVSVWKAADLMPLGISGIANSQNIRPLEACSDGVNFWVTRNASDVIVRY